VLALPCSEDKLSCAEALRCIIGWNIVATTEGRTTHFDRRSLATIAGVTIVDAVLPQLVRM
jgi:hypothetical protein